MTDHPQSDHSQTETRDFNSGVTAYLCVPDAEAAIAFYTKVFGAKELFRQSADSGKILHATLEVNGGKLYLSDDFPEMTGSSATPAAYGGTPVTLHQQVPDVDAVYKACVDAGCEVLFELQDVFWGDRFGKVRDPFGHEWSLATTPQTS